MVISLQQVLPTTFVHITQKYEITLIPHYRVNDIGKKRRPEKVSACAPLGARTLDTLIKSQVLYQLS